jgi:hypothetical protein
MSAGVAAMREEVEAIGDPVLTMWWDYVVNQAASEKLFPIGVRDKGRAGPPPLPLSPFSLSPSLPLSLSQLL